MSDDVTGTNDDPNMTTITLNISEAFLDDLDATWRAEDFPSRSEFIRWALRDAVKHPTFSRKGWKDIAVSEHQLATGDGRTYSSDEIQARLNEDTDAIE
jgi:Arc/MetJ-type ribon-helix-helix transcriptional regulator